MMAMLTAKDILSGERKFEVWDVNQDAGYHEAGAAREQTAEVKTRFPVMKTASPRRWPRSDSA
ncbi:MAG: hypothetical protein WBX02_09150 [Terriglobales bacterium]